MKRVLTGLLLAGLCGVATADVKLTGENTKVEWTGTKPGGKHTGGFHVIMGTVTGSEPTAAKIDVTFMTDSIFSDDEKLTGHLKSPDFFDVKTHPKATFKSTKIEKDGAKYKVTGDFSLLGKSRPITFPAEITMSGDKLSLTATFSIDRTQFGMVYGKGKVDDKVGVSVKIDAK